MKGWVGHGHPECLIEHEGICRVQRPGSEQAGAAFRARQDGYTDVPGGGGGERDRTVRELGQLCGVTYCRNPQGDSCEGERAECLMRGIQEGALGYQLLFLPWVSKFLRVPKAVEAAIHQN